MSNAPTDAYISDVSTPRLSRMDVFTPQSIQWDQLSSDNGHAQIMTKSEAGLLFMLSKSYSVDWLRHLTLI